MNQTFAVPVVVTEHRTILVYVKAPDKHEAADKAHDFTRLNLEALKGRAVFSGRELDAYAEAAQRIEGGQGVTLDVEV